jgi:SAM-dependent methyltransferase
MGHRIDLLQFPRVHREIGTRTDEHRAIARRFDKDFFDGSRLTGYGGYVNDGRWHAVADRIIRHYHLHYRDVVLDIGCAKGFLLEALFVKGMVAFGCDISAYALSCCSKVVISQTKLCAAEDLVLPPYPPGQFRLIVSINTLHNLERDEIVKVLRQMEGTNAHCYITLDAYETPEQEQRMRAWNLTAKTILHVDEWLALFKEAGYTGDYDWFMP